MLQTWLAADPRCTRSIFLAMKTLLCLGSTCGIKARTCPAWGWQGPHDSQRAMRLKPELWAVASGNTFPKGAELASFFLFDLCPSCCLECGLISEGLQGSCKNDSRTGKWKERGRLLTSALVRLWLYHKRNTLYWVSWWLSRVSN